jgi:sensor histidine kinase regulating citrate/malate metabolism
MSAFRRSRWGVRDPAATSGLEARVAIARVVMLVGSVVALILVAGIVLTLLGANPANQIVKLVHDAARWLAGPFDGLFKLNNHKTQVAVDWGLAAVVYFAISRFVGRVIVR